MKRVIILAVIVSMFLFGCKKNDNNITSKNIEKDEAIPTIVIDDTHEDPLRDMDVIYPCKYGSAASIKLVHSLIKGEGVKAEDIAMVNANDFDGDGREELFVFVKDSYDEEFGIYTGALWYVTDSGCSVIEDTKGKEWANIDGVLDFSDKVYAYMDEYYVTGVLSYVWEVKDDKVSRAIFSECGGISSVDGDDFTITLGLYDEYKYAEDEMLTGHTWKPYYFYYDRDLGDVREYGAGNVNLENISNIFGENISEKIGKYKDIVTDVMYRANGILTLNTIETDEYGTTYGNINYDCKKKVFLDVWDTGTGSVEDSNFGGTYLKTICPQIATFPTAEDADFISIGDEEN